MENNFVRNLKALIKIKGFNMGDFEEKCGIPSGYILRMIISDNMISLGKALLMAETLGMTIDEIVNYDSDVLRLQEIEIEKARLLESLKQLDDEKQSIIDKRNVLFDERQMNEV